MSSDLRRYSDEVWDRFFDFVLSCDKALPREEVQATLKRRGINTTTAFERVKEALKSREARAWLERARQARTSSLAKRRAVSRPAGQSLRATLQELIGQLTGQQQAAYFHKLEKAATDNDLQSLLEDLHHLDDFETDSDDGGEQGQ